MSGEEALKKTTLRSLGLTGGSAIVRYIDCLFSSFCGVFIINSYRSLQYVNYIELFLPSELFSAGVWAYGKAIYNFFLRFLLKNKTPGEEDGREVTETVAVPATPVAKETTPSPSSQPDPAPSCPETSPTDVPIKSSDHDSPMEALPTLTPVSFTSTLPVQQEEVPKPQDTVRPKVPPAREMPEEDGEEAGPSGLNSHHSSSSPSAPSAVFIPFSGGGQRLGGLGVGAVSSALLSSSLSPLTAAVESPKAKKAKSSYSSSAKVSY